MIDVRVMSFHLQPSWSQRCAVAVISRRTPNMQKHNKANRLVRQHP